MMVYIITTVNNVIDLKSRLKEQVNKDNCAVSETVEKAI